VNTLTLLTAIPQYGTDIARPQLSSAQLSSAPAPAPAVSPSIRQQLLHSNGVDSSPSRRLLNRVQIRTLRSINQHQPTSLPSRLATPVCAACTHSHCSSNITTSATHANNCTNSNNYSTKSCNSLYHPAASSLVTAELSTAPVLSVVNTSACIPCSPSRPSTSCCHCVDRRLCFIRTHPCTRLHFILRIPSSPRAAAQLVAMSCSLRRRR